MCLGANAQPRVSPGLRIRRQGVAQTFEIEHPNASVARMKSGDGPWRQRPTPGFTRATNPPARRYANLRDRAPERLHTRCESDPCPAARSKPRSPVAETAPPHTPALAA